MYLICQTEDIPEREARGFDTPLGEIFVTQRDGSFFAYQNICPLSTLNNAPCVEQIIYSLSISKN